MNKVGFWLGIILVWCLGTVPGQRLQLDKIQLRPNFKIEVYAQDVPGARSMAQGKDGIVFVGTRSEGKVYAILDKDGDRRADEVITIAKDLNYPNGVAFRDGHLYVAEISRILRYDNIEKNLLNPPKPVVVTDQLPQDKHHGWKFIRFGPDGNLYIPIGAPCNICEKPLPYATIGYMKPEGGPWEVYAQGVRNTVGFDWHPQTKELWFTENGRDWLGDDLPPDELNCAPQPGLHFGFPYFYGQNIVDPMFPTKLKAAECTPSELDLGAHVAALGMRFYRGTMFPSRYQNQIFIAEHGSWNRSTPIGYRLICVRLEEGKAVKHHEIFAHGWILDSKKVWGRPVDVEELSDGSLLVSDDHAGALYRITYQK